MKFSRTDIHDVFIIEPQLLGDERGYFSETFKEKELSDFLGHPIHFCQDNESKSSFGVLRGLHFQLPPFAQTKLVRVIKGKVLDVAVDIRKGSPTFGKHVAIELTEENKKQLLIPKGFAHGFIVQSNDAIVQYFVDAPYSKENEIGINYASPRLDIDWGLTKGTEPIVSEKDKLLPNWIE